MAILLLFLVLIVAVALLFWRLSTQSGYRVKNRDKPRVVGQGRRMNENGPNLRDMLD